MAAEITLPDGIPAIIDDQQWYCAVPRVIPVLLYFTKALKGNFYDDPDWEIAKAVASMIIGTTVFYNDPPNPLRPGIVREPSFVPIVDDPPRAHHG